jgi:hypothetical protein
MGTYPDSETVVVTATGTLAYLNGTEIANVAVAGNFQRKLDDALGRAETAVIADLTVKQVILEIKPVR